MTVEDLIRGLDDARVAGDGSRCVAGLSASHADVLADWAFVAIRGARFDGHEFLGRAVERGARTLIVESAGDVDPVVTWVVVPDTRVALATLAANAYDSPWNDLTLVGVTGTNGKTSTAYLVQSVLEAAGIPCARFGTVGYQIGAKAIEATTTTPDR